MTDEPPKPRAYDFALERLRADPDASYDSVRAVAELAGITMRPILYGRAKAALGLVPVKPRKSPIEKEPTQMSPPLEPVAERQPGPRAAPPALVEPVARERRQETATPAVMPLRELVAAIAAMERNRKRHRELLVEIAQLARAALDATP